MPLILICLVAAALLLIAGIFISDWLGKRRERAFLQFSNDAKTNRPKFSLPLTTFWNWRAITFVISLVIAVALYHRKTFVTAKKITPISEASSVSQQPLTNAIQFAKNSSITLAFPKRSIQTERITYRLNSKLRLESLFGNDFKPEVAGEDSQFDDTARLFELCSNSESDLETIHQSDSVGSLPYSRSELSFGSFEPAPTRLLQK